MDLLQAANAVGEIVGQTAKDFLDKISDNFVMGNKYLHALVFACLIQATTSYTVRFWFRLCR